MSRPAASRRGEPLVVLLMLLTGWLAARVAMWEPPFSLSSSLTRMEERYAPPFAKPPFAAAGPTPRRAAAEKLRPADALFAVAKPGGVLPQGAYAPMTSLVAPGGGDGPFVYRAPVAGGDARPLPGLAVGHALLAIMGLSNAQMPASVAAFLGRNPERPRSRLAAGPPEAPLAAPLAAPLVASGEARQRRWSGDFWLLAREGGPLAPVAGQPSYGRSQAGAVLRYRLAPGSRRAPQAYARVSSALSSPRDAEIAAGLSARPLPRVPVRLAAEVRVADTRADNRSGSDLRPAVYAVTEFPPLDLPLGTRAEAYAQGGYVGGDFATPFADGHLRVTRDLARADRASFAAGVGAWGGAQKGAARLDVGPTASVSFSLGEVYSRLSVDYRVRVAGDAEPKNGPALTLSAGF